MGKLKQYLENSRIIHTLPREFGDMILRRSNLPCKNADTSADAEALYILAAAALAVTQDNHSCLYIQAWCDKLVGDLREKTADLAENGRELPELTPDELAQLLKEWQNNCLQMQTTALERPRPGNISPSAPLVLCETPVARVYLNRLYKYETAIASLVLAKLAGNSFSQDFYQNCAEMIPQSSRHFAERNFAADDQMQAIANVLQTNFAIVTGGPGRGKTTVLTEILAFELLMNPEIKKIALCAPTGKAAARMKQSINAALTLNGTKGPDLNQQLFGNQILDLLRNLRPGTVHSLLGINDDSDYPRANARNRLDYDLIAVDECSMMSLQLFAQLLQAIKPETKLVLLGDENQLASVDEGTVLAELCHSERLNCLSSPKVINRLTVNHRSEANAPLCAYTDAIVSDTVSPDVEGLFADIVREGGAFHACEIAESKPMEQLENIVADSLKMAGLTKSWQQIGSLEEAFQVMESFKILTPVREGNYGVTKLNSIMRKLLKKNNTYDDGVPVMVVRNDSITELKNGDIGVCYKDKVYFKTLKNDGTEITKAFSPAQLPPHECAFAMTIHKSQGSDYTNVLMVLPNKDNPILTRELIYTGISRTKINFNMLAKRELLEIVQKRKLQRWSGLGFFLADSNHL